MRCEQDSCGIFTTDDENRVRIKDLANWDGLRDI